MTNNPNWHDTVSAALDDGRPFQYLGHAALYAVPSVADPEEFYQVAVYDTEPRLRTCQCLGFRYRGTCKHLSAVP